VPQVVERHAAHAGLPAGCPPLVADGVLVGRFLARSCKEPSLRLVADVSLDVQRELGEQLVGQVDDAFAPVLRRADLDRTAPRSLHLPTYPQAPVQEVDVPDLHGRGLAQPQTCEGRQGEERREAIVGAIEDCAHLARRGHGDPVLRLVDPGQREPLARVERDDGSRTAPRSTARTLLVRVRIVPGLSPASAMISTHCSRCDRRSRFIGTSPKVTVLADRSMAFSVVDSHTCRVAHSR
jgi:hypothetical protein